MYIWVFFISSTEVAFLTRVYELSFTIICLTDIQFINKGFMFRLAISYICVYCFCVSKSILPIETISHSFFHDFLMQRKLIGCNDDYIFTNFKASRKPSIKSNLSQNRINKSTTNGT